MEEFEPKRKYKIFNKEFLSKYAYVLVLAVLLLGGITYGYTFFVQNRKVASGSITTAALTINFSDRSISASSLSVPTENQEGLSEYTKSLTITNQTAVDGIVNLSLTRTSGLNLEDLSYAVVVNGAIQTIADVPSNGVILETAIMGNETINVEVRLWPKTSYSGSTTTFVGEITPEIKYLGTVASNIDSPAGKYVNFNCSGNTCEVWQIVKVEDNRLVLTRQADYTNATSRTNSNRYNPASFNPTLTLNDDSLISSLSTDGKNVYLAKAVKITGGSGTIDDPYVLSNNIFREGDNQVVAVITYKDDNNTTVGTQNVYYNETNYISQVIDDSSFQGWTDGTNNYVLGDTVSFTSDINLTAITVQTLKNKIMTLCNDNNIAYVQKYDAANNGAAIDTPDGSGNEDVCYYTTASLNRNSDAEQNANVIFGDFCWQIVRTTADGGVKLLYNGLKTNDNKCTSDADTNNYSSNPRPSTEGVNALTYSTKDLSGDKKYGTGFELYDDNGTTKFKLTNVFTGNWENDYASLIGKYTCLNNTDTICTTLYYIGHKRNSTTANTVSYTISTTAHYSLIGKSAYNAFYDSPALVGYMYNDVYTIASKSFYEKTDVINKQSSPSAYYYGDEVSWDGTYYHLIDSNTNQAPTNTQAWTDIRSIVGGKYTCKSSDSTTGTYCTTVYYIVANSDNSYMYSVPLSNNETKDKQVTWKYGTGINKSGNTYTLTGTNTLTFKLADWYTNYANYKNIYVCDDFTSTTCLAAYFIVDTSDYQKTSSSIGNIYYFASDINYDSNTNTYSYDTSGTIVEVYDWPHQYNTLNSNHYMCENYDSTNNTCGANNPMYFAYYMTNTFMYYVILNEVPNIETTLVNMLSKDTGTTVNRYNSAIKGIVDNWYKQNIDDNNLSGYLDNNAVFCNDRTIANLDGWSKTGSTTSNYDLRFKYYNYPSKIDATLACSNVTDRFSKTNQKATLTYSVGLLSEAERALMDSGFVQTGQYWWLSSSINARSYSTAFVRSAAASGSSCDDSVVSFRGVRPAIVLKPGIEISGGNGTYDSPYVVKTNNN